MPFTSPPTRRGELLGNPREEGEGTFPLAQQAEPFPQRGSPACGPRLPSACPPLKVGLRGHHQSCSQQLFPPGQPERGQGAQPTPSPRLLDSEQQPEAHEISCSGDSPPPCHKGGAPSPLQAGHRQSQGPKVELTGPERRHMFWEQRLPTLRAAHPQAAHSRLAGPGPTQLH